MGQLRALMTRWPPSMSFATKHWRAHMAFFESLGVPPAMMPQVRPCSCCPPHHQPSMPTVARCAHSHHLSCHVCDLLITLDAALLTAVCFACGQVIIKAPQLFAGLSLENTLKPRVQHFLDMTQLPKAALPQVLAR